MPAAECHPHPGDRSDHNSSDLCTPKLEPIEDAPTHSPPSLHLGAANGTLRGGHGGENSHHLPPGHGEEEPALLRDDDQDSAFESNGRGDEEYELDEDLDGADMQVGFLSISR